MEEKFQRHLNALEDISRCVRAFAAESRLDKTTELQVLLAVEEVFANMVVHNRNGRGGITVGMSREAERIVLWLVDEDAEPFDLDSAGEVRTDAPIEEREVGGLGLHLVRSMVDEVTCDYGERRLTITMVKDLGSRDVRNQG